MSQPARRGRLLGMTTITPTRPRTATRRFGRALVRVLLIIPGAALAVTGMGLTLAFGVFAFIGIPLLAVGLGLVTAAIEDV
jgi:hypothetical protein